jgi:TolA-binding protein
MTDNEKFSELSKLPIIKQAFCIMKEAFDEMQLETFLQIGGGFSGDDQQQKYVMKFIKLSETEVSEITAMNAKVESLQKKVEELEAICESERAKINILKEVSQQQHEIIQQLKERNRVLTTCIEGLVSRFEGYAKGYIKADYLIKEAKQLIKQ